MARDLEDLSRPPRSALGPTPASSLLGTPYLRLWNAAERFSRYVEPHDLPAYAREHFLHLEATLFDCAMKSR